MRALVTGAGGFIAKNLIFHLTEKKISIIPVTREISLDNIVFDDVDFIFHLAGENRPINESEFNNVNYELTKKLCNLIIDSGKSIPVLYTSSTQASNNNPYGLSKLAAENTLIDFAKSNSCPVYIYRLPNVFGKWSRPNYNSVVATFCHNIANEIPINIYNPSELLNLVYIDDVVEDFMRLLNDQPSEVIRPEVSPVYKITVGDLAEYIRSFKYNRESLLIDRVGSGLERALYSTYLSYISPNNFSYLIPSYNDARGRFVEMLKTKDSGQFSYFTAHPGISRGGHYHHTKNEKFLVVQGKSKFCFRHIITNETITIFTDDKTPQIVETIPGWAHEIKNIGDNEMIVLIWANEIFNNNMPDTVHHKV